MKGQMFVAGAAMFVVLLVLIANSITAAPAMPNAIALSSQLDNLAQEYRYATGLSVLDGTDRLDDLSKYFRLNVQNFGAIYALIAVRPSGFDVKVGNYLRYPSQITISVPSATPPAVAAELQDKQTIAFAFDATGSVQMEIKHAAQNTEFTQPINFTTGANMTIGWFDIGIRDGDSDIRRSGIWIVE